MRPRKMCRIEENEGYLPLHGPHLSVLIYNCLPLFRNFSNITAWLSLTQINISNNNIGQLPKEFGTLPFLQQLNLSRNCLGISDQHEWLWIQQFAIRKRLLFLNMSYNSLTQFPLHIQKLHTLRELEISYNMLQSIPQGIRHLKNLELLDVSYNRLLYLPANITFLRKLTVLGIKMNPFLSPYFHYVFEGIPSLMQLSAASVLNKRVKYNEKLPYKLVAYLDEVEYCWWCKIMCPEKNWCRKVSLERFSIEQLIWHAIKERCTFKYAENIDISTMKIETYLCVRCCKIFHCRLRF